MNGLAAHGGVLPVGGTFFVFSDYMRGAVRLAALSEAHVIFSWTHDSVGLGEDGPTHQPIEQLASLRAMPGLRVIRPADANETAQAWRVAVDSRRSDGSDADPPERSPFWMRRPSSLPGVAPGRLRARSRQRRTAGRHPRRDRQRGPAVRGGGSGPGRAGYPRPGGVVPVVGAVRRSRTRPTGRACCPRRTPPWRSRRPASFGWERYADDSVIASTTSAPRPRARNMVEFGFTSENVTARAERLLGANATD